MRSAGVALAIAAAAARCARDHHDQRQRRQAHRQQQPVADAPPLHRLIRNLAQEHQRGKRDDRLALLLREMDQDRHRECGEPEQEQRRQERHAYRVLASRCRIDRKRNSA
jgi:hypothetical protein